MPSNLICVSSVRLLLRMMKIHFRGRVTRVTRIYTFTADDKTASHACVRACVQHGRMKYPSYFRKGLVPRGCISVEPKWRVLQSSKKGTTRTAELTAAASPPPPDIPSPPPAEKPCLAGTFQSALRGVKWNHLRHGKCNPPSLRVNCIARFYLAAGCHGR